MRDSDAAQNLLTDPEKQAFFLMTNLKMVLVKFVTSSQFDPRNYHRVAQDKVFSLLCLTGMSWLHVFAMDKHQLVIQM